ncbi:hypothetical protein U0070_006300 [Myodes glareolus]|uniref:Uncharacterized protein n=1 Tax=Myodes glareolus TaxID=447135 RepID=A0AAW0IIA2_MYOGA
MMCFSSLAVESLTVVLPRGNQTHRKVKPVSKMMNRAPKDAVIHFDTGSQDKSSHVRMVKKQLTEKNIRNIEKITLEYLSSATQEKLAQNLKTNLSYRRRSEKTE